MDREFVERTAPYRRELLAHCYRMTGSLHDAEDLLQDTLLRAWRAYGRYDSGLASLRTWLHRIATNVCLTALEGRARRPLPSGLGEPGRDPEQQLVPGGEVPWLQPFPGTAGTAGHGDPADLVAARGSLRLALVAAMQLLPPRQRAVLILRDVLAWSAAEVATALDTTPVAVNSALQRARARLDESDLREEQLSEPSDAEQRALLDRYSSAFERADLAALGRLLTADAILEMPPFRTWFAGRADYLGFMARVFRLRGTDWRVLSTTANGGTALAAYAHDPAQGCRTAHSLQILDVGRDLAVRRNTVFQDPALFAAFGLPPSC